MKRKRTLPQLANSAAKSQERWHNGVGTDLAADRAIRKFELAAAKEGYVKITWPGLFPLVEDKSGRQSTIC